MPQSIEAERAVLGAILIDNAAIENIVAKIATSDFFHTHHKTIFRNMVEMHAKQKPIDLVNLIEVLHSEKTLENVGGAGYISQLMDGVPHVHNAGSYADIVKEKSRLRGIIRQADAMYTAAFESGATADELESKLRANITEHIATNGNGNGHLGSSLMDFLAMDFPAPEHLVEQLIPRGGSILIVALPHRMKSWFTTSLALACTREGTALGKLEVQRPVRTMLVQVEDHESIVKQRISSLITTPQFMGCDPSHVWVVKRSDFNGFTPEWCARLRKQAVEWKADLIILDVLRRIFQGHGDLNSPIDSANFLERIDEIRDAAGCAIALVHHENKKDADLMNASAGSYNFPGWANVVIQFKGKTMEGAITKVEIEVDNKLGVSAEPMRMVLDLASSTPVRLEHLEEGEGESTARERLIGEWTVRDLMEALDLSKDKAYRRIKKWKASGSVETITKQKTGRGGGMARFRFLGEI
jgi:hypothetical protein